PKTAALEVLVEAHATELKLPTVKARFRQLAAEATSEQQTPVAYLSALLEAEHQQRAERRQRRRLIDARFPRLKRLEEFRFADSSAGGAGRGARDRAQAPDGQGAVPAAGRRGHPRAADPRRLPRRAARSRAPATRRAPPAPPADRRPLPEAQAARRVPLRRQ